MGFFSWLRRRVCDSVLAGCADAAERLDSTDPDDTPEAARRLWQRLQALPAANGEPAPAEAEVKGRQKTKA